MIVRVFETTGEIELAGSAKELSLLSRQLLFDNKTVNLEYESLEPFPYSRNLESIQVKHFSDQAVKISIEGNSLLIEGSRDKLLILSENFDRQGDELKNYHIHIEYYDGHFFLSPDSKPLIVNFK
jgi:hypothetical protein